MMSGKILLARGFAEGEPASSLFLAEGLSAALARHVPKSCQIAEFRPKMLLPSWFQGAWGMRLARYLFYPLQFPQSRTSVVHFLDHGYAHVLYSPKVKNAVVTVTDLIPVLWWKGRFPGLPKKNIPLTVLYSLRALKRAKHIITISASTKSDLVELIGCDPQKISVIYPGIDPIFRQYENGQKLNARRRLFGVEKRKIILITGSQFYKNHETALKTIRLLLTRGHVDICLAKTGIPHPGWLELVKKHGLEDQVINLGFISRDQMPDLYNAVDLLMFPSFYEGFGWPPLEAMACGTPAVTSNAASLAEVMETLETTCDPFDVEGFANKILHLLSDDDHRSAVILQGLARSAKFTWDDAALQVLNLYHHLGDQ